MYQKTYHRFNHLRITDWTDWESLEVKESRQGDADFCNQASSPRRLAAVACSSRDQGLSSRKGCDASAGTTLTWAAVQQLYRRPGKRCWDLMWGADREGW